MKKLLLLSFTFLLFLGCEKSVKTQMHQYMEFYYPTTGKFYYEIMFDWGYYTIDTEYALQDSVDESSIAYKGYITMRPNSQQSLKAEPLFIYLITPAGEVWESQDFSIPETKTREVVVEEKTEYGTSTSTSTINSGSEPIIDHFMVNKTAWTKYAELKSNNGKKFSLHLIETSPY